ncbi:MAG TPA: multidrug resistance protein [bacterium]|nr:multidrug resistance protein [bacterium]
MSIYLVLVVVLSAAGQVLVKAGANLTLPRQDEAAAGPFWRLLVFARKAMNPWLVAGIACVALVPLLYTRALAGSALSTVYGATGLSYPLVIGASALFFGERIGRRQIVGGVLIVAGFIVWSGMP